MKKWIALFLGLVLAFSMTGCLGHAYETMGTIDGVEITSGLYLMAQYTAYNEARNKVEDAEKDVFKQKVDGQSANAWINDRTVELLKKYVCVRRLCREKGISLDSTGQQNIEQTLQYWTYLEELYHENGISETSFTRYLTMEELSNQLFVSLYSEGGELYVPDSELKAEYGEKYAHVRAMSIPVNSMAEGVDVRSEVVAMVEAIVATLKGGKTLEEVAATDVADIYSLLERTYDVSTAEDSIYDTYMAYEQPNSDTYTPEFLSYMKSQELGDYGYYDMGSTILLYQKIKTFDDQAKFDEMRQTVLSNLKLDEYNAYLASIYDSYTVSFAFGARFYYRPKTIVT